MTHPTDLCTNCLRRGHTASSCTWGKARRINAPEPFLQIRRHLCCCGITHTLDRYSFKVPIPGSEGNAYTYQHVPLEHEAIDEIDEWARIHRLTCQALKDHDEPVAPR